MTARSRAALVIGGTGRIGRLVARALATHGADVAVHCHAALPAARALAAEFGGASLAVTADLREEGAVRACLHRVADHFGRLDAVAVCAGRRAATSLEEATAGDLRLHYDVNVAGAFVVAQEAGLVMARQEQGGTIVFVGAGAAPPSPGDVPYAASRSALTGLARALMADLAALAPRVQVDCVEPATDDPAVAAAAVVARITAGWPAGAA